MHNLSLRQNEIVSDKMSLTIIKVKLFSFTYLQLWFLDAETGRVKAEFPDAILTFENKQSKKLQRVNFVSFPKSVVIAYFYCENTLCAETIP